MMFNFVAIPWFGVVICMIVAIVSGSLWFRRKTFFPIWWQGIGKTGAQVPGGGKTWAWCLG
jgi:hypothetical protein